MQIYLTLSAAAFLAGLTAVAQPAGSFHVYRVNPPDGAHDVPVDVALQAHVSERFDPATITGEAIRLWQGGKRVAARVSSDLGGVLTLSPESPLASQTAYRFEITHGVKSSTGMPLRPFTSRFHTGNAGANADRTLPPFRKEKIGTVQGMTSLVFLPGGNLLAGTWEGALWHWKLDAKSGRPVQEGRMVWRHETTRITALCADPDSDQNHQLWLASDDNAGASVCPLRFTARIARLTFSRDWAEVLEVRDYIIGLPVGDHAVSGLVFAPKGELTFFCGATTMLGGDKPGARETPLSAAVLIADVRASGFLPDGRAVNVNTESPVSYDPRVPNAPVRIFATGIREAYDLCWHSNGQLYAGVNQNDTREWSPALPERGLPAVSVQPDEPLIRIVEGAYYGHPNPSRDEWVLMGGNPTAGEDPWEIGKFPTGTKPEAAFDPTLLIHNLVPIGGQSANGCAEWLGPGPLRGRLLMCFYTSARTLHTFRFTDDGSRVEAHEPLSDRLGRPIKLGAPLDLAIDSAAGRIYVADFADTRRSDSAQEGTLWLLEPED